MKERPILFSAPMVRAILDGRKMQTRRAVKPQPRMISVPGADGRLVKPFLWWKDDALDNDYEVHLRSPYGRPGDRLYVKEHAWMYCEKRPNGVTEKGRLKFEYVPLGGASPVWHCENHPERPVIDVVHPETGNVWLWRKKLGRFLPKWASRITLEVVAVRVERLNMISESDAQAEGVIGCERQNSYPRGCEGLPQRAEYAILWNSINGAGSWESNPLVWVVEFRRVQP